MVSFGATGAAVFVEVVGLEVVEVFVEVVGLEVVGVFVGLVVATVL